MMPKVKNKETLNVFFFFLFLHVTLRIELLIKLSNKLFKLFANLELHKHIFLTMVINAFTVSLSSSADLQKRCIKRVHCF